MLAVSVLLSVRLVYVYQIDLYFVVCVWLRNTMSTVASVIALVNLNHVGTFDKLHDYL